MMTSSNNGNIFRVTGPLCGEFTGHRWISLTKPSDAELWCFLWSAPWINGWVNNGEAGDLRPHRAHYDVTVMHVLFLLWKTTSLDRPHIRGRYIPFSLILQSSHHVVPPSCSSVFWGSSMCLHYVSTSVLLWLPWWTVRIRIRETVPAATAQWTFSLIEPSARLVWSWWRHQMETFSALLSTCAGNRSVPGEFPAQRPVTWSFDIFFDLRLNKRLGKQWRGWWFETLSRPLWRHRNCGVMIWRAVRPTNGK